MKAAIVAVAALMGMTACNREAKQGGEGGAADTAASATSKIKEEAREAGKEIGEATDKAVAKTKEETRQTSRDVKEGAEKLTNTTEQGAKKTTQATKETTKETTQAAKAEAGKLMPGDAAATAKDQQLVASIRTQLAADKETASEARDVRIEAENGKVELEGTVTSQEVKTKISRIASRLAGAKNVTDDVKIAEQVGTGNTER